MLTARDIQLVQTTFHLLRSEPEQIAHSFYTRLFELDPDLRRLFPRDMSAQGRHLMAALGFVAGHLARPEALLPVVRELGRRHVAYGVEDRHYAVVGEALLWTLGQDLGEKFGPEEKAAWTRAYGLLAAEMTAPSAPAPQAIPVRSGLR